MQAELINAIRRNPDDNFLKLVYADWLDEQGSPLAEIIRVEVQMRQSSGSEFSRLSKLADRLRKENGFPPRIEWCPACVQGEGYREEFVEDDRLPGSGILRNRRVKCRYCENQWQKGKWFHPLGQLIFGKAESKAEPIEKRLAKNIKARERRKQKIQTMTGGY